MATPGIFDQTWYADLMRYAALTERAREYGWRRYTDDAGETRWMHPDGGWAEFRNEDEFAAALDADAERYRAARAEQWEAA